MADKNWDGRLAVSAGVEDDAECLSISKMDGKYSTMRPANKQIECLHVIKQNGEIETYIYAYLDVKHKFKPGEFVVTFAGSKHWELTVTGNNLWRLYSYICLRRWSYLRIEPRNFDDKEEVVTGVVIRDVTPREG